jgi:hypothetical protein
MTTSSFTNYCLGWMGQVLSKGRSPVKGERADFSVSEPFQLPALKALMKYARSAGSILNRL